MPQPKRDDTQVGAAFCVDAWHAAAHPCCIQAAFRSWLLYSCLCPCGCPLGVPPQVCTLSADELVQTARAQLAAWLAQVEQQAVEGADVAVVSMRLRLGNAPSWWASTPGLLGRPAHLHARSWCTPLLGPPHATAPAEPTCTPPPPRLAAHSTPSTSRAIPRPAWWPACQPACSTARQALPWSRWRTGASAGGALRAWCFSGRRLLGRSGRWTLKWALPLAG